MQVSKAGRGGLLEPISQRLSRLVKKLVYEQSSSAVIPRSWDKYRSIMSSCLVNDAADEAIFQTLVDRNFYLQSSKSPGRVSQRSPQQQIISFLDSACSTYDINATSEACLSAIDDKGALIDKVLEWCSTPFRQGLVRVYIAVRLLRKWRRSGMDTDHHIFSFLLNAQGKVGLQLDNVYHVISELVRSQTFSVARYLQWLIAKGVVNSHQDNVGKVSIASINDKVKYLTDEQKMSPHVELLRHLPVGRLPEHVRSLRNTLMLRAGFPASEEGPVIDALKSLIGRHLPGIFGAESRSDLGAPGNVTLLDQTHAVRSEIGQWIRSGVSRHSGNIVTR